MFFFLFSLVFSSELEKTPPAFQEIRAIATGRIAFLQAVLTYQSKGSLVDFFRPYFTSNDYWQLYIGTNSDVLNSVYANIFLTARVHIQWYEGMLQLLETPAQQNTPDILFFMIARAQEHMPVHTNAVGMLEKCGLNEKKYFAQIQGLLCNSCDPRLFLQFSSRKDPHTVRDEQFTKMRDLYDSCVLELEQHPSQTCAEDLQKIRSAADGLLKEFCERPSAPPPTSPPDDAQKRVDMIRTLYSKCLQNQGTVDRERLLSECSEKYAAFFTCDQYIYAVIDTITFWKHCCDLQGINKAFEGLLRQIDTNKIRLRMKQEALTDFFKKEERRRAALVESSERECGALVDSINARGGQMLQLRLCDQRQQLLYEEEDARLVILRQVENAGSSCSAILDAEEQARAKLPWTAFLSREELQRIQRMKQAAASADADRFIQPDDQTFSEAFFEKTQLFACITDINSESACEQHAFLSALRSFGKITEEAGGAERRYDVWDINGVRHCGFFHMRHGADLTITNKDWRFKNIVNTLKRAGYLR